VQSLQSEVGILSKLVDDIHMLSMTEVAPLAYHWEQVDVVELLDTTLSSWQERLAVRGLSLKRVGVIDRMLVSGDPNRLRQVFQNLLENAVRYVDQGGTVQVGCQAGSPGVIIDFDDSGPEVSSQVNRRHGAVAAIATIYSLWLFYAADVTYLLFGALLVIPGMVPYVWTRLRTGNRIFNSFEWCVVALVALGGVCAIYGLSTGVLSLS